MLKRIRRDQAQLGMHIHSLEGSWFSHPFWRRRFVLTDPSDLAALLDSDVEAVIIDIGKGRDVPAPAAIAPIAARPPAPKIVPKAVWPVPREPMAYRDPAAAERARAAALRVVTRSKKVMRAVFDGARLGKAVESAAVMAVVADVSDAIEKNRDAFLKVIRLKSKDEYTYLHSVAVCALMVNLASQLGMEAQRIADLGTAGLLHDIGKMAVPAEVLNKPAELTDAEFALVRTHPEQGYRLLAGNGLPDLALDVCRHHHEKFDGSGYPHRLSGEAISLAARMGAICDVYDALTSDRIYKSAWEPVEAVTKMRSWEGHFDSDLLIAFMRSIGVFPVGMVVSLRSNRLGIVLDNGRRASRPQVLAFYSTREREPIAPETVTIGEAFPHDAILDEADPAAWGIDPALVERLRHAAARPLAATG